MTRTFLTRAEARALTKRMKAGERMSVAELGDLSTWHANEAVRHARNATRWAAVSLVCAVTGFVAAVVGLVMAR